MTKEEVLAQLQQVIKSLLLGFNPSGVDNQKLLTGLVEPAMLALDGYRSLTVVDKEWVKILYEEWFARELAGHPAAERLKTELGIS